MWLDRLHFRIYVIIFQEHDAAKSFPSQTTLHCIHPTKPDERNQRKHTDTNVQIKTQELNEISCDPLRPVTTHQCCFMPPYKKHTQKLLTHTHTGCVSSEGLVTVLLTSSAARQMRFNPWSEPVVLYNDVATKFTLLLVTITACEKEKYASACSARIRVQAVMRREHQGSS